MELTSLPGKYNNIQNWIDESVDKTRQQDLAPVTIRFDQPHAYIFGLRIQRDTLEFSAMIWAGSSIIAILAFVALYDLIGRGAPPNKTYKYWWV